MRAVWRALEDDFRTAAFAIASLQQSLGNDHEFIDGNKRIAFTATDVFLRRNGFYIDVSGPEGHEFIDGSMNRREFRFPRILDWIRQHIKPLWPTAGPPA